MHDPFLKSVFANPRMVEILIRHHVEEWVNEIDFATLREEPTERVIRKTLQRRHPDMIWSAQTVEGRKVLFLMEFQGKDERLMALRTSTYATLTMEDIAGGMNLSAGEAMPEFVVLVLYHGDGRWHAPTRVKDLFQRSDPGGYRLVPWQGGSGEGGCSSDDLVGLVLGLARNLSAGDMAEQLVALRRAVEELGDTALDAFMVERVDTVLELRGYPEELKTGGERTMAEMVDRFQRSLDELVQKGARQGQAGILRRQVTRRFGEETAGRLSELLEAVSGPEAIDRVTDALFECGTGEEFIERVRTA